MVLPIASTLGAVLGVEGHLSGIPKYWHRHVSWYFGKSHQRIACQVDGRQDQGRGV
jgi:hypothetical protein